MIDNYVLFLLSLFCCMPAEGGKKDRSALSSPVHRWYLKQVKVRHSLRGSNLTFTVEHSELAGWINEVLDKGKLNAIRGDGYAGVWAEKTVKELITTIQSVQYHGITEGRVKPVRGPVNKRVMSWSKVSTLVFRFWSLSWTNRPKIQLKWKLRYSGSNEHT